MKLMSCIAALVLAIGCAGNTRQVDRATSDFGYLSLHWEAAGTSNDIRWCELAGSGERLALDPEVVLAMRHFAAARTTRDEASGSQSVDLVMTEEGRQRIKELSAGNVGRRLAIVLENEVVALAAVWRTIDSEALNLPPMPDAETAEEVADGINAAIAAM